MGLATVTEGGGGVCATAIADVESTKTAAIAVIHAENRTAIPRLRFCRTNPCDLTSYYAVQQYCKSIVAVR